MFYVVEKVEQLERLRDLGNCFIKVIPGNDYSHPCIQKTNISLIYLHPVNFHKGYILCIDHNESLGLPLDKVFSFLRTETDKLFTVDKKETLHYIEWYDKLFDINFISFLQTLPEYNKCIEIYYSKFKYNLNINKIIPISKHYEYCEQIFIAVQDTIKAYRDDDNIYSFNNNELTTAFFRIEQEGISIDKNNYIHYFASVLSESKFSIKNGKIYSQYNLYTLTGRPSNTFNNINFAALNKVNGERATFKAENDVLLEIDYNAYHPRLIEHLLGKDYFQKNNVYEVLAHEMHNSPSEAKELVFQQIYGGVRKEYLHIPFFNDINEFVNHSLPKETPLRILNIKNKYKHFNYYIQALETKRNVEIILQILEILKNKKTKLILYTYDSFLFDFSNDEPEVYNNIVKILGFPVSIKHGKNYHELTKI